MYRVIFCMVLCLRAATTAPPDSSVTFVRIQPPAENATQQNATTRDFRLDDLPPTVATHTTTLENAQVNRPSEHDAVTTELQETETTSTTVVTTRTELTSPRTSTRRFTKPSPRFISKLSYYSKTDHFNGFSTNLLDKSGKLNKRRYKSRCRCEKISNCPKLQITVPRCPEEYFICCF